MTDEELLAKTIDKLVRQKKYKEASIVEGYKYWYTKNGALTTKQKQRCQMYLIIYKYQKTSCSIAGEWSWTRRI